MNTDPPRSLLETAAQIAAIIAAIIAYLALAYQIGGWPFDNAKVTPVSSGSVAPTLALASAPTAAPIVVPPTAVPTRLAVSSSSSALGIGSTKISADGATMVFVPAGEFLMGSSDADKDAKSDEKPQHVVYLDAFWIDKFEVTNAQLKKCVDAGKCREGASSATRKPYYGDPRYDDYPALDSWEYAKRFCEWAGRRLPTEAEWEKAARGTDGRIYPWGNSFDQSKLNSGLRSEDTTAVGSFPGGASPYGAMDMAGNVWEWVADWYDSKYYSNSPRDNPMGPSLGEFQVIGIVSGTFHVLRGGGWLNPPEFERVARRSLLAYPNLPSTDRGFRCDMSVSP